MGRAQRLDFRDSDLTPGWANLDVGCITVTVLGVGHRGHCITAPKALRAREEIYQRIPAADDASKGTIRKLKFAGCGAAYPADRTHGRAATEICPGEGPPLLRSIVSKPDRGFESSLSAVPLHGN